MKRTHELSPEEIADLLCEAARRGVEAGQQAPDVKLNANGIALEVWTDFKKEHGNG